MNHFSVGRVNSLTEIGPFELFAGECRIMGSRIRWQILQANSLVSRDTVGLHACTCDRRVETAHVMLEDNCADEIYDYPGESCSKAGVSPKELPAALAALQKDSLTVSTKKFECLLGCCAAKCHWISSSSGGGVVPSAKPCADVDTRGANRNFWRLLVL